MQYYLSFYRSDMFMTGNRSTHKNIILGDWYKKSTGLSAEGVLQLAKYITDALCATGKEALLFLKKSEEDTPLTFFNAEYQRGI